MYWIFIVLLCLSHYNFIIPFNKTLLFLINILSYYVSHSYITITHIYPFNCQRLTLNTYNYIWLYKSWVSELYWLPYMVLFYARYLEFLCAYILYLFLQLYSLNLCTYRVFTSFYIDVYLIVYIRANGTPLSLLSNPIQA